MVFPVDVLCIFYINVITTVNTIFNPRPLGHLWKLQHVDLIFKHSQVSGWSLNVQHVAPETEQSSTAYGKKKKTKKKKT